MAHQTKISKGYRLKPSTHKLIKQVQSSLNITQDRIISTAVKLFRKEKGMQGKPKVNK
ncbi:MAG TPA: hypothetical protein VJ455_02810 [Ignavibacteria bacterium]|nr:hypothetical protein [Ignavibacteria bacterium]